MLASFLAHEEREVRSFNQGLAALEATKKSSFDILVTDLMMPGADGIQVLKEAKRVHPEGIVIIMTGYASLDTAIQAIRGGAYDYIQKPFKLDELEIVVHNACEKIRLLRENRRLFQKLKETMEELDHLRKAWDDHLAHFVNTCWMISQEKRDSEMKILLNQINPAPPDYPGRDTGSQDKEMEFLERLVQLKQEGFIDGNEFLLLKKRLLEKYRSN
jgi:DNA-binding response OmpR family regulator